MTIAFDRFAFDPDTLELSRDGERIDLAPKPGLLLKAMIAAAPGILARDEAQAVLWPNGPHADPEQGLNACVRQLRAALGDGASEPAFIETLSKRGYRFIAPLRVPGGAGTRTWSRIPVVAGAAAILFVLAILWGSGIYKEAPRGVPDAPSAQAIELFAQAQGLRARNQGDDLLRALDLYESVLGRHPGAAAALAGKAMVVVKIGARSGKSGENFYATALEFAALADAVRPLADAAAARAYVALYRDLDPAAALREFESAAARDGEHAESFAGMAAALSALGRAGDAIAAATRAAHIDPLSYSARSDRCWYLLFDDQREEAEAACTWAIEIDGDHRFSYLGLALARYGEQSGMVPPFRQYLAAQGLSYADGDIENGHFSCQPATRLASRAGPAGISAYEIASFFGLCGDANSAGRWLQRAIDAGQAATLYAPFDPRFDAVRDRLAAAGVVSVSGSAAQ